MNIAILPGAAACARLNEPAAANDYKSWLEAKIETFKDEAHWYGAAPTPESLRFNFFSRLLDDYRRSLAMVYEYEAEMATWRNP